MTDRSHTCRRTNRRPLCSSGSTAGTPSGRAGGGNEWVSGPATDPVAQAAGKGVRWVREGISAALHLRCLAPANSQGTGSSGVTATSRARATRHGCGGPRRSGGVPSPSGSSTASATGRVRPRPRVTFRGRVCPHSGRSGADPVAKTLLHNASASVKIHHENTKERKGEKDGGDCRGVPQIAGIGRRLPGGREGRRGRGGRAAVRALPVSGRPFGTLPAAGRVEPCEAQTDADLQNLKSEL